MTSLVNMQFLGGYLGDFEDNIPVLKFLSVVLLKGPLAEIIPQIGILCLG